MSNISREGLLQSILEEFIEDVKAAGADHTRDNWPDLHVTYEQAVQALSGSTLCLCDGCGYAWQPKDIIPLEFTPDLNTRLDPGGVVPAGECPECHALVYRVEAS